MRGGTTGADKQWHECEYDCGFTRQGPKGYAEVEEHEHKCSHNPNAVSAPSSADLAALRLDSLLVRADDQVAEMRESLAAPQSAAAAAAVAAAGGALTSLLARVTELLSLTPGEGKEKLKRSRDLKELGDKQMARGEHADAIGSYKGSVEALSGGRTGDERRLEIERNKATGLGRLHLHGPGDPKELGDKQMAKDERRLKIERNKAASLARREESGRRKTFQKALNGAARRGDVAGCRSLLDDAIGQFSAQEDGMKALNLAAREGHPEVVSLLLSYGANVDAANEDGATALWMAEMYGHPGVAKLLISNGAAPVVVDDQFLVKSMTRLRMEADPKSAPVAWLHPDTVLTLPDRNNYQKGTHVKTARGWTTLIDKKGNAKIVPLSQGKDAHDAARRRAGEGIHSNYAGYDIDRDDIPALGLRYGTSFASKLLFGERSVSPEEVELMRTRPPEPKRGVELTTAQRNFRDDLSRIRQRETAR